MISAAVWVRSIGSGMQVKGRMGGGMVMSTTIRVRLTVWVGGREQNWIAERGER